MGNGNNPTETYAGSNIIGGLATYSSGVQDPGGFNAARMRTPPQNSGVPPGLAAESLIAALTGNANPVSLPNYYYGAQPAPSTPAKSRGTMKPGAIVILGALLAATLAFGQSDNTLHVKEFPGLTVGAKVAAAQAACPSSGSPCLIVIDASLASFPTGVMPAMCASCHLYDYRSGALASPLYALNGTPMADQFAGVDMCAKIRAAAVYALANGVNQVDATHFAGTQACATNMLQGLCPASTASCNLIVNMGAVHIQSSVAQSITNSGIALHGMSPMQTQLEYIGATVIPYIFTVSDTTNGIANNQISGIFIYGDNANATNGVLLADSHHSQFSDVDVWGVATDGVVCQNCVSDDLLSYRASKWDATALGIFNSSHSTPATALYLDALSTVPSSDVTCVACAAEFLTGTGWVAHWALNTRFVGGTSESNVQGAQVDAESANIKFVNVDFESNTGLVDVLDNGTWTDFDHVWAASGTTQSITLGATSLDATISGGKINGILQDSGAAGATYCVGGACTIPGALTVSGTANLASLIVTSAAKAYHYIATGVPSIAPGTGAGTSPTTSIAGNDEQGSITITTGTAPAASAVAATVSPTEWCPNALYPVIQPANAAAASLSGGAQVFALGTSASTWTINANSTALAASSTYVWEYSAHCN